MSFANLAFKPLAALAGAGLLLSALTAPASAMPLPALPGAGDVSAPIEHVWWDRWGHWHRNFYYRPYYRPYYHPYYYRPYYHPYWHRCWNCY